MGSDIEPLLSDLVVRTTSDEIPAGAMASAARQLYDCVGVALAASVQPAGMAIASVTQALGGEPQARLLGSGLRTSVVQAAWANGALAHLLDFDDTGFSHPTACILPAVLAVGEWVEASGRDVVASLVLGYEVFERLSACARPSEPVLRSRGYHPTSLWGTPAAAAATGKLLGLDVDQLQIALGIAASDASGVTQQFGTWAKGLNAGNAARSGVMASLLAAQGYWGDSSGISGEYGLFSAAVGDGNWDTSSLADELGTRWSIEDPGLSIKPYPACTSTLRAVDAMLLLHASDNYSPDRVEQIVVEVHPDLLHTLRYFAPTEGFRGKFSLDYTVAAAALDGVVTLESFTDEYAARPDLRAMLDRIELERHPEWPIERRHDNPVHVRLVDGTVLEESVPAHKGSRAWQLSDEEIRAKFRTCAGLALPEDQVVRASDDLIDVIDCKRITDVVDLLSTNHSSM